ncbi:hypothetical protein FQR65_LT15379 [Abscondita terminalis]|nr:hypothetical protein FQR65_LT15379 [Abscondita terminalis]
MITLQEVSTEPIEDLTETFLNNLPMEIDGILYEPMKPDEDDTFNQQNAVIQETFTENVQKSHSEKFDEALEVFDINNKNIQKTENLQYCKQILDAILECVFDVLVSEGIQCLLVTTNETETLNVSRVKMDSSLKRPCCVPGCTNRISKRHVITTHKQCRDIWLHRINNTKLFEMDDKILKNHRICQENFEDDCIEQSGKLKKFSLPTLHLLSYVREGDNFLRNVFESKHFTTPEKVREAIASAERSPLKASGDSLKVSLIVPQRTYKRKKLFVTSSTSNRGMESMIMDQPSTSKCKIQPSFEESMPLQMVASAPVALMMGLFRIPDVL